MLRVAQGQYREALELVDEGRQLVGPDHRYGRIHAETTRARAHLGLGDIDQAKDAAAEAVAVAETTDALDYHALAQLALAEVHAAAGELSTALEAAREASRIWATLDRKLLEKRARALLEQLEDELTRRLSAGMSARYRRTQKSQRLAAR